MEDQVQELQINQSLDRVLQRFPQHVNQDLPHVSRYGSSGQNIIHIFPNFFIKDFLTRPFIGDEIEILTQLQGNPRFFQILDIINEPNTKLIMYENLRPILDNGGTRFREEFNFNQNPELLTRLIYQILSQLVSLAEMGWYHGDVGLGNIGYRNDDNRFILYDYEDAKRAENIDTLKEKLYHDIESFLEDLIIKLRLEPNSQNSIDFVQGLLNSYEQNFKTTQMVPKIFLKKKVLRRISAYNYEIEDILNLFNLYADI